MSHGSRLPKVGMYASVNGTRGRVVTVDSLDIIWRGRQVKSHTVDLSTEDGLLVGISVRNLD